MNIVYYSSDLFSEMCGVAIQSLCENNKDADDINIYVVEDNISDENKKRLNNIVQHFSRKIFFIKKPEQKDLYPEVKYDLGHTYARMALAEILPSNVDRVLSLDSDTLVLDSIQEMYNTAFEKDQIVAGVYDCVGTAIQKRVLQASDSMKYCNAGVLLIDLKKWREKNIGQKLVDKILQGIENNETMFFLEQDILNIVLDGHIKLLEPQYNMLTSIYIFGYDEIIKMKKPVEYYTKNQIIRAKKKPAIIHATTCFYVRKRMWIEKSDSPYAVLYAQYRKETEWNHMEFCKDTRGLKKKLYGGIWHIMPRKAAVCIAAFMINCVRPTYAKITVKMNLPKIAKQS